MRVRPCGHAALLVEAEDPAGLAAAARGLPGVEELVPAAATVLVQFDPHVISAGALETALRGIDVRAQPLTAAEVVELPVWYDGADLNEVAALTGLVPAEVAERHCAPLYTVAFCGFSPGFAYMTGGDPALRVPRRDTPRTAVPPGAVAIADEYTGVYPRRLPGGWRLLGHTDAPLWRLDRDPPALLVPGLRVRFTRA